MNILVFSWRDPKHPLAGGAEQVMHEHMKGWVAAGNKVTLFSSRTGNLPQREVLDRVEVIRGGHQYLGVQLAGIFYYLKNGNKFDFLIDQFHGIPFFTPIFSRSPKLAVIQEPAREVWFTNPLPFPLNWIIGLLGFLLEPLIFLFYKNVQFMTGSDSAKRDIVKLGIPEKNIKVVPHGVLTPRLRIKAKRSKIKTITYLGMLSKDKGIEDAIKAFRILGDRLYRFWVIGKGETSSYENKISRLSRGLDIKFWGYVDQKRKFELLAKSSILINPSIREGWGLVNIEANSVGVPVVAYNSPGLIDSVKDGVGGVIVKRNKPEVLAWEVKRILSDARLYEQLRRGAGKWSEKFDWLKSKRISLDLIRKIYEQN